MHICSGQYNLSNAFHFSCRNYNPVERRGSKGGNRNVKGIKSSKSLQTNTMNHSGSGDSLSTNRTFGLLMGVFEFEFKLFCSFFIVFFLHYNFNSSSFSVSPFGFMNF